MAMNPTGIKRPAGFRGDQHLPANPLQISPKSWVDRLLLTYGYRDMDEELPGAITVHPCVIDNRRFLVYEKGLARKNPAALAQLTQFAQENGFGLKEDQRTANKRVNFERRMAKTVPMLMLAGGLFLLNSAAYAAGSSKFKDWLFGEEAQAMPAATEIILDDASKQCMTCHKQDVSIKGAGGVMEFQGHQSKNHPVGMDYGSRAAKDPRGYFPVTSLNKALRLVDGRVTCITCHKIKEDAPAPSSGFIKVGLTTGGTDPRCTATTELTVGPRTTDLCLSCHNK